MLGFFYFLFAAAESTPLSSIGKESVVTSKSNIFEKIVNAARKLPLSDGCDISAL